MAHIPDHLQQGFTVGDRFVEPARNRIRGPEGEVHVEPKVMAVLVCLAAQAGEVVSRGALYDAVWGKAIVSDQALTNCISELRQLLGDDRAAPRYIETVPKRGYRLLAPVRPAHGPRGPAPPGGRRRPLGVVLGVLAVGGALVLFAWWSLTGTREHATSVVVVPFENPGDDAGLDYLRFALPDEITSLLTASRNLVVRPFEHERHGTPLEAGRARNAAHVVTGHYYLEEGDRLTVAVEAQDVAGERLVWRARVTVPAGDLLGMRAALAERVQRGLLPALGVAAPEPGTRPAAADAYRDYLRSLALPKHPEQTVRAIELLERAVALDPQFAPAWSALGLRWYEHGNYGEGREAARTRALAAYRKALELDPAAIPAAVGIVVMTSEAGELEEAYREAKRLVERFDANAEAHLALALVHRFGGLLDASQRHCERAYALDPGNPRLRSCGYSFLYDGKLDRVQAFLDTDEGSYFSHWGTVLLNLRRGDDAAALVAARRVAPDRHTRWFMEACLEGARGEALEARAAAFVGYWSVNRTDPELAYALAPMLEYCGRRDAALEFLARAVAGNFCAFPALDRDPIWGRLRRDARFPGLREDALACHHRYRQAVQAVGAVRRAAAG
ncbi:MAG TPA: winged helix-turn-helix domain-containing protein [Woeseiaceae bacterium]|nr:winged helix-turn-helix domain-containing protein [Woeseiaceae bacterium]